MALSNLRCTGRQELWQSQNVLALLNAMKLFWMFRVKKFGLNAFSEVWSLFLNTGECWQEWAGRRWTGTVRQRLFRNIVTKKQKHLNPCCAIDDGKFGHRFIHAFSACCSGARVVKSSAKFWCLVSFAMLYLSWMFREQFPTLATVQFPCFADVTASLKRRSCTVGVFSIVSRVIMGNFVEIWVRVCRFGSRYFVFRDFPNSNTLSRHFKNIAPFYTGILNVHRAPRSDTLFSKRYSSMSIALFAGKTLSVFRRLFNPPSRFEWDINFSQLWSEIVWRHSFWSMARVPNGAA